ncbi:sigma-70 family RNA polymerase sigma factor [Ruania halotolerans]|uniref:sigma-70 family RNA polymerase sigma factor n=1 Tax=Ruania halotolerans TaxID=2897773 RepID=UPI001E4CAB12|nr:sigma-70 family RNA polymerase sigma factor [Ruania halotolerans]UFU05506.1 sigma-70 family RNA polymerase sigma factor [Ruania halotolerans]
MNTNTSTSMGLRASALGRSDLDLVESVRSGDETAFAELWSRHGAAGVRAARKVTDRFDADDLVQEAFVRILSAIRRGKGPSEHFRPYMYATIRSISMNWARTDHATTAVDDLSTQADPDAVFEDAALDRTLTGRAFAKLRPEWQTILWYTEVEGMPAREAALHLGITPRAASALACRAREGLRSAWLQAHVAADGVEDCCRWTVEHLGAYTRDALGRRDRHRVQDHLTHCVKCAILVEEIDHVAQRLDIVLLPLLLGPAALALTGGEAAASGAGAGAVLEPVGAASASTGAGISGGAGMLAAASLVVVAAITFVPFEGDTSAHPQAQAAVEPAQGVSEQVRVSATAEYVSAFDVPVVNAAPPSVENPDPADGDAPAVRVNGPLEPDGSGEPDLDRPPTPSANESATGSTMEPEPEPEPADLVEDPEPDGVELPAAPRILTVDDGHGMVMPRLAGDAEPGAIVVLTSTETGAEFARTVAASTGEWMAVVDIPQEESQTTVVAMQETPDGVSVASDPVGPFVLDVPRVEVITNGVPEPQLRYSGPDGASIETFFNGSPSGNVIELNGGSVNRTARWFEPGQHTIGVRYVDPADGRYGHLVTVSITVVGD